VEGVKNFSGFTTEATAEEFVRAGNVTLGRRRGIQVIRLSWVSRRYF
jgi:hypothetical protein